MGKPEMNFNIPVGYGIDFNLSDAWKLILESHFNYALTDLYDLTDNRDGDWFMFNSIGVAYNFSCNKDTDGDGVPDA